jgi:hypothetical protein
MRDIEKLYILLQYWRRDSRCIRKKINVNESSFEEMAFGMPYNKKGMSLTTTTEKMNDDKQSL